MYDGCLHTEQKKSRERGEVGMLVTSGNLAKDVQHGCVALISEAISVVVFWCTIHSPGLASSPSLPCRNRLCSTGNCVAVVVTTVSA